MWGPIGRRLGRARRERRPPKQLPHPRRYHPGFGGLPVFLPVTPTQIATVAVFVGVFQASLPSTDVTGAFCTLERF